ncbi:MAG TPA: DUF1592 domain-containing protein [Polyangiaceae bacterium]|nr:DUF1592 domain-containing protein [Polyangiaceae bacterium]
MTGSSLSRWLTVGLSLSLFHCSHEITGGDDGPQTPGNPANPAGGSASAAGGSGSGNPSAPRGGSSSAGGGRPSASNGGASTAGTGPIATGGTGDTGLGGAPGEPLVDCQTPGPRLIRRLTAEQYRNSLVDLFQDETLPDADVLSDPAHMGFHVDADQPTIRDLDTELLMNYAESVAAWAVQNKMWRLTSCTTNDQTCRRQFIQTFGQRVQREPLSAERTAAYEKLFMAEATFEKGVEVVTSALLQSPYMLYRRELGQPDPATPGQFTLTPYEVASELAFFLTASPPDDQLLEAAAQGKLATRQDIDREANRLIYSKRARGVLAHFVQGWLEVDPLPLKAKQPNATLPGSLRTAMLRETEELFWDAFNSSKSVSSLLNASHTFLNGELSAFYQVGNITGEAFQRVDLKGSNRAPGLLGHGAFLATHAQPENSSPVQRGIRVRERLLCQDLPPVPDGLDTNLDAPASFKTNRERYSQHSASPACAACHSVIDPVGFAFEKYDGFGRFRSEENGTPVDASGSLTNIPEGELALTGVDSLAEYLAKSDVVRSCFVRHWSYFAHGRDTWEQKQCNHDAIRREASQNNYSVKSVMMGILHAPTFTRRVKDQ